MFRLHTYKKIAPVALLAVLIGHAVPAEAAFGFEAISSFFSRNKTAALLTASAIGLGLFCLWHYNKDKASKPSQSSPISTQPNTQELESTQENSREEIIAQIKEQRHNKDEAEHHILALGQKLGLKPFFVYDNQKIMNIVYRQPSRQVDPYNDEKDTYKIHLTPKTFSPEFIYDLVTTIKNNPKLSESIDSYKFTPDQFRAFFSKDPDTILAPVTIYCFNKEAAQTTLNILYTSFKDTPGSGECPRFNAKVTNLIYVTQGNGDYKGTTYTMDDGRLYNHHLKGFPSERYEDPERIYIKHDLYDKDAPQDIYYLYHPETGDPLISGKDPTAIPFDPAAPATSGSSSAPTELNTVATTSSIAVDSKSKSAKRIYKPEEEEEEEEEEVYIINAMQTSVYLSLSTSRTIRKEQRSYTDLRQTLTDFELLPHTSIKIHCNSAHENLLASISHSPLQTTASLIFDSKKNIIVLLPWYHNETIDAILQEFKTYNQPTFDVIQFRRSITSNVGTLNISHKDVPSFKMHLSGIMWALTPPGKTSPTDTPTAYPTISKFCKAGAIQFSEQHSNAYEQATNPIGNNPLQAVFGTASGT